MRIEVVATNEAPGFQFVVKADSELERVILGQVARASGDPKVGRFTLHGVTRNCDIGWESFNFGWAAPPPAPLVES